MRSTVNTGPRWRALALAACTAGLGLVGVIPGFGGEAAANLSSEVSGMVHGVDGEPLEGATVSLGDLEAQTDESGSWSIDVSPGTYEVVVSLEGFVTVRREVNVGAAREAIDVTLVSSAGTMHVSDADLPRDAATIPSKAIASPGLGGSGSGPLRLTESVVVQAVRAEEHSPVTKTNIDREQIEAVNRGQETPFLLGPSPSVNYNSDTGLAAGYSYFNVRGIGQTRLNITLDGAPLQDPEDQALYFANFGDFASVVDSVQIQRGIGTSSYGSASYGGSVNFASVNPGRDARLQAQAGAGSWGTGRGTIAVDGPVGGGVALYGRLSAQTTDGFRDHSGVEQRTLYFGATRQDDRSLLKLFGFVGREKTQLSYLATEEAILRDDLRYNELSPEEKDDFGQDFVQLQYTHLLGSSTMLTAQGYYNGAQGWFRIQDWASGDLQEFALDGHFVGLILGLTHHAGSLALRWGGHVNDFTRDHWMDVVGGSRQYLNTGLKREASTFVRATWDVGQTQLWADAQVRHARFEYQGDQDLGSVEWTFFNPKAGIRFEPTRTVGVYAFAGRMSREPTRSDLLHGEDNASLPYDFRAVAPEKVIDVEAGIEVRRKGLSLAADLYSMSFRDEIALSGELSEIGLPVRRNVPRSHRRGVEVEARWTPGAAWRITGAASLSRNRIDEWTQYYDVYGEAGDWIDSIALVHRDVPPLLTPEVLLNAGIAWEPSPVVGFALGARWVGESQLDNTGSPAFRTPSWFNLDGQLTFSLARWVKKGEPRLRVQAANLLDNERLWPSGYSYLYFVRGVAGGERLEGTSYYYPLATRSVYMTLDVTF